MNTSAPEQQPGLLMDVGNSALKTVYDDVPAGTQSLSYVHGSYDINKLLDEYYQTKAFSALTVASVYNAAFMDDVYHWCTRNGVAVTQVKTQKQFAGLYNGYEHYADLGVDRWLAMLALWEKRQQSFALASLGTALTFDWVDDHGRHQGGLIAPGINLMQQSLAANTAAISGCEEVGNLQQFLQKNTSAAVTSGTVLAVTGLLEKIMSNLGQEFTKLVLTGGDASAVLRFIPDGAVVEHDLVLQGMQSYAGSRVSS